jgi:transposase-like protein
MEIIERKVKQVDQKCPVCGQGYMRPTGIVAGGSHEHKCTQCDYKENYPVRYPYNIEN